MHQSHYSMMNWLHGFLALMPFKSSENKFGKT